MSDVSIDTLLIKLVSIAIIFFAASWGLHHLSEFKKCENTAEFMNSNSDYDVFAGCWLKDDKATHWSKLKSDY